MKQLIPAIADGRTDLVFEHIARGGAASDADGRGVPLIRWCAYYGDVSAIRHLIAHGEKLETLGENLDLNGAAFHGHWRLCAFLIENGADASAPLNETGETPLHAALSRTYPDQAHVVAVLLAAGADPNAKAADGAETGAFMRDARTRGETPLHRAALFGSLETIDLLLDAGAKRDATDARGESPLGWASWRRRGSDVLRRLCFAPHSIHPDAHWEDTLDARPDGMAGHLQGKPRV